MKSSSITRVLLTILSFCILTSCKEWSAENMVLVEDNGQETMVIIEKEYTITQSETRGGTSYQSGYTTYYLTNYDAKTGEENNSIRIGDSRNKPYLIAKMGRKIWLYTSYDEYFFHSRDAFTLEVIDNQQSLAQKNTTWSDEFITGNSIGSSPYQLDNSTGDIFFSSSSGRIYSLDIQTLEITPEDEKLRSHSRDILGSNVFYKDSLRIMFEGEGRENLVIEKAFYRTIYEKLNDEYREADAQGSAYLKKLREQGLPFSAIRPIRDSIRNIVREKRDSSYNFRNQYVNGDAKKEVYEEIDFIKPKVLCDVYYTADSEKVNEKMNDKNQLLCSKDKSLFFVVSDSKVGEDKTAQISALTLSPKVEINWAIELENLDKFYRIKSGDTGQNFLVIALEKHLICINTFDGSVAWRKDY